MGFIKNALPESIYSYFLHFYLERLTRYKRIAYSQEGEDLILERYFVNKREGFYVDVGALHPRRFSNTYLFYLKGWKGINIEPRPGSSKEFNKIRPRDINLELPISDKKEELTYYLFNDPALNGFSKDISLGRVGFNNYKIVKQILLKTQTLEEVLDSYLPKGQEIDFLTIDAEGFDYNVIISNNWEKYRPKVILIEDLNFTFENMNQSKVFCLLKQMNYNLFAKSINTIFFIRNTE